MLKMSQVNSIKDLSKSGYRVADIAKKLGIDRKTVRKYLGKDDFSPHPPVAADKPSMLDPYKPLINKWLKDDQRHWHKQQHTAKRVFDELREKTDFTGSYSTVQRYVRCFRKAQTAKATQELVWDPGTAQIDFGEAEFEVQGKACRRKYLVLSFPYSNDGFVQVFGGETAECVCQGLKNIFEYLGGVPHLLIFDNATGVGRRVGDRIHETELFQRFHAHYGFRVRFCNPYAGYEKGNVERKVAYVRKNLFVPVPQVNDFNSYNRLLLDRHKVKASELHYKKGIRIEELFKEDKAAMYLLPAKPFNICRYERFKADGYGKICLDGKHYYSTRPEYSHKQVLAGIYADHIDILDEQGHLLVTHERIYGTGRTDSSDYSTTLHTLLRNPGAWQNSGIRQQAPDILKVYMDQLDRPKRKSRLKLMCKLADNYDLQTAMVSMERCIHNDTLNASDATVLAERIAGFGLDTHPTPGPSLAVYDAVFLKGGAYHDSKDEGSVG